MEGHTMSQWNNDEELFTLMKEKLYTPVVGDILDQMGYKHQFLPAAIRPLEALVPADAFVDIGASTPFSRNAATSVVAFLVFSLPRCPLRPTILPPFQRPGCAHPGIPAIPAPAL